MSAHGQNDLPPSPVRPTANEPPIPPLKLILLKNAPCRKIIVAVAGCCSAGMITAAARRSIFVEFLARFAVVGLTVGSSSLCNWRNHKTAAMATVAAMKSDRHQRIFHRYVSLFGKVLRVRLEGGGIHACWLLVVPSRPSTVSTWPPPERTAHSWHTHLPSINSKTMVICLYTKKFVVEAVSACECAS